MSIFPGSLFAEASGLLVREVAITPVPNDVFALKLDPPPLVVVTVVLPPLSEVVEEVVFGADDEVTVFDVAPPSFVL